MTEVWKNVPGTTYEASNEGRIRGPSGIIEPFINNGGYPTVSIFGIGNSTSQTVARLVCMAFYGLPEGDKCLALHRDDNKKNSKLDNLYWGNHFDNLEDRRRNGKGGKKLTIEDAREIRKLRQSGEQVKRLAKQFDISVMSTQDIIHNRAWRE